MTKEEKLLSDKYGKDPGFTVPKGYFEDFADRMMAQIPENSTAKVVNIRSSHWHRLRPYAVAAASVCVAIFSITTYVQNHHDSELGSASASIYKQQSNSDAWDEAVDYTMFDNADLYASMEDFGK
ncbi:hypothetical protein [Segatella bryantii]|uniref:hypothetical protein n=1 Tax=Segatella bryantii TaxID=77095 RepID=UPI0008976A74|nr:hypothetical protein [Segatella bryantii]SEA20756.1 hypothetical protein SAMN05216455_104209 [Segatella bryantii]